MRQDWAEIRRVYEHGALSLRQVAHVAGVSESAVLHRAAREAWRRKAKVHQGSDADALFVHQGKAVDARDARMEARGVTDIETHSAISEDVERGCGWTD